MSGFVKEFNSEGERPPAKVNKQLTKPRLKPTKTGWPDLWLLGQDEAPGVPQPQEVGGPVVGLDCSTPSAKAVLTNATSVYVSHQTSRSRTGWKTHVLRFALVDVAISVGLCSREVEKKFFVIRSGWPLEVGVNYLEVITIIVKTWHKTVVSYYNSRIHWKRKARK